MEETTEYNQIQLQQDLVYKCDMCGIVERKSDTGHYQLGTTSKECLYKKLFDSSLHAHHFRFILRKLPTQCNGDILLEEMLK